MRKIKLIKPMKYKLINNEGFTLLEILITIVILTIGLAGTGGLLLSVIKSNDLSNEMSKATALAQSSMEQLRQAGYVAALEAGESATETNISGYPGFTRTTEVTSTGVDGAKAVKITISFISFGQHDVEMNTILAR